MNGIKKITSGEVKIQEKSDIIITGKPESGDDEDNKGIPKSKGVVGEESEGMSSKLYSLEKTKRMGIFVSHPKKDSLCLIVELIKYEGERNYQSGDINTIVDNSKLRHTYKVRLLHEFKKPITLQELRNYQNCKTGNYFKNPPQIFYYLYFYPELVKDVIAGKFG